MHYACVTDFVQQPVNSFFRTNLKNKLRGGADLAIVVDPVDRPMGETATRASKRGTSGIARTRTTIRRA